MGGKVAESNCPCSIVTQGAPGGQETWGLTVQLARVVGRLEQVLKARQPGTQRDQAAHRSLSQQQGCPPKPGAGSPRSHGDASRPCASTHLHRGLETRQQVPVHLLPFGLFVTPREHGAPACVSSRRAIRQRQVPDPQRHLTTCPRLVTQAHGASPRRLPLQLLDLHRLYPTGSRALLRQLTHEEMRLGWRLPLSRCASAVRVMEPDASSGLSKAAKPFDGKGEASHQWGGENWVSQTGKNKRQLLTHKLHKAIQDRSWVYMKSKLRHCRKEHRKQK